MKNDGIRYSDWYQRNRSLYAILWTVGTLLPAVVMFAISRTIGVLYLFFMIGLYFLGQRAFRR
jgi:hypothetical protein